MFGTDFITHSLDLVSIMFRSSDSIKGNTVPSLLPVFLFVGNKVSVWYLTYFYFIKPRNTQKTFFEGGTGKLFVNLLEKNPQLIL